MIDIRMSTHCLYTLTRFKTTLLYTEEYQLKKKIYFFIKKRDILMQTSYME